MPRIEKVASIDIRLRSDAWDFVADRAKEIEANWRRRVEANPRLYNGKVLLMRDVALHAGSSGGRLEGACFVTDYKIFQAWQDLGQPGDVRNLFALAALRTADGAYLLGEMAAWTANAGRIYFPGGTPDLDDLDGDTLDLDGSAWRELAEETGLKAQDVTPLPGWTVVFDGALVACMKELHSARSAAELVTRISHFLAQEKNPEFARLVPVFGPADINAHMPAFMQSYLRRAFNAD
jgi:8-oxo-dGTP pyrophosphatase MutT (NUDIX family)